MKTLLLAHISSLFSLLPLAAFLLLKQKLSATLKLLLAYVLISLVAEAAGFYTSQHRIDNTLIFRIYTYVEALLVFLIFKSFTDSAILKRFILLFMLLTMTLGLLFFSYSLPHEYVFVVCSLLIVFLCVSYLYKTMAEALIPSLLNESRFWLVASFLIYFGTSVFLTLFETYIRSLDQQLHITVWSFHNGINIIYNTSLAISIWKTKNN